MNDFFEIIYQAGSGVSELNPEDKNIALQISAFSDICGLACDAITSAAKFGVTLPDEITAERLHTFRMYMLNLCLKAHDGPVTRRDLSRAYRMASDLWSWSQEVENGGYWEMGGKHWGEAA